jgi:hypothetical protein
MTEMTETQREALAAVEKHKSQVKAAASLGISRGGRCALGLRAQATTQTGRKSRPRSLFPTQTYPLSRSSNTARTPSSANTPTS